MEKQLRTADQKSFEQVTEREQTKEKVCPINRQEMKTAESFSREKNFGRSSLEFLYQRKEIDTSQ